MFISDMQTVSSSRGAAFVSMFISDMRTASSSRGAASSLSVASAAVDVMSGNLENRSVLER